MLTYLACIAFGVALGASFTAVGLATDWRRKEARRDESDHP